MRAWARHWSVPGPHQQSRSEIDQYLLSWKAEVTWWFDGDVQDYVWNKVLTVSSFFNKLVIIMASEAKVWSYLSNEADSNVESRQLFQSQIGW